LLRYLRQHNLANVGEKYLEHLMENGRFKEVRAQSRRRCWQGRAQPRADLGGAEH
jgi:hypothetical protein